MTQLDIIDNKEGYRFLFIDNVIILFMDLAGFFLILFKTIIGNWFLTLNNCKNYMK